MITKNPWFIKIGLFLMWVVLFVGIALHFDSNPHGPVTAASPFLLFVHLALRDFQYSLQPIILPGILFWLVSAGIFFIAGRRS